MTKLKKTPLARLDEERHFLNIANDNLDAAIRWLNALEAGYRHILLYPDSGSNRPLPSRPDYASLQMSVMKSPFQKWVIYFLHHMHDNAIEVIRVLHGAEDRDQTLGDDG